MTTIRDIAEICGVSTSTVSHVINGTRFVSPETRDRVLQAMKDLNYQHNRLASSLRNQKTQTIGVLLPNNANPFFAEILSGIETACSKSGYTIFMGNAHDEPERERQYLEMLLSRQVDGILLISTGDADTSLITNTKRSIPVVVIDRSIDAPNVDAILTDNEQGGRLAAEYLLRLGHRRIACITGPSFLNPSALRVTGFTAVLNTAGITPTFATGDFLQGGGYQAAQQFLDMDEPPTAIFACNDMMALGALCAIQEAGFSVPDDFSVIGYDDIAFAAYAVPRLTTIRQPAETLGQFAVQRLVERLAKPAIPPQRDILPVTLIERHSCKGLTS